jgi:hypothetical protein
VSFEAWEEIALERSLEDLQSRQPYPHTLVLFADLLVLTPMTSLCLAWTALEAGIVLEDEALASSARNVGFWQRRFDR